MKQDQCRGRGAEENLRIRSGDPEEDRLRSHGENVIAEISGNRDQRQGRVSGLRCVTRTARGRDQGSAAMRHIAIRQGERAIEQAVLRYLEWR